MKLNENNFKCQECKADLEVTDLDQESGAQLKEQSFAKCNECNTLLCSNCVIDHQLTSSHTVSPVNSLTSLATSLKSKANNNNNNSLTNSDESNNSNNNANNNNTGNNSSLCNNSVNMNNSASTSNTSASNSSAIDIMDLQSQQQKLNDHLIIKRRQQQQQMMQQQEQQNQIYLLQQQQARLIQIESEIQKTYTFYSQMLKERRDYLIKELNTIVQYALLNQNLNKQQQQLKAAQRAVKMNNLNGAFNMHDKNNNINLDDEQMQMQSDQFDQQQQQQPFYNNPLLSIEFVSNFSAIQTSIRNTFGYIRINQNGNNANNNNNNFNMYNNSNNGIQNSLANALNLNVNSNNLSDMATQQQQHELMENMQLAGNGSLISALAKLGSSSSSSASSSASSSSSSLSHKMKPIGPPQSAAAAASSAPFTSKSTDSNSFNSNNNNNNTTSPISTTSSNQNAFVSDSQANYLIEQLVSNISNSGNSDWLTQAMAPGMNKLDREMKELKINTRDFNMDEMRLKNPLLSNYSSESGLSSMTSNASWSSIVANCGDNPLQSNDIDPASSLLNNGNNGGDDLAAFGNGIGSDSVVTTDAISPTLDISNFMEANMMKASRLAGISLSAVSNSSTSSSSSSKSSSSLSLINANMHQASHGANLFGDLDNELNGNSTVHNPTLPAR